MWANSQPALTGTPSSSRLAEIELWVEGSAGMADQLGGGSRCPLFGNPALSRNCKSAASAAVEPGYPPRPGARLPFAERG
jgi:hypothetical protein